MKRRSFLGSALAPLVLSPSILARTNNKSPDFILLDERFPQKRLISSRLPHASQLISIRGDITPAWNGVLKQAGIAPAFSVEGVTSETTFFCLQRLLHHSHDLQISIKRIDQEFYAWSIEASNKNNKRRIS